MFGSFGGYACLTYLVSRVLPQPILFFPLSSPSPGHGGSSILGGNPGKGGLPTPAQGTAAGALISAIGASYFSRT